MHRRGSAGALVDAALADGGITAERLHLENNENLFIQDPNQVWAVLERLRQRGISIVLDDFGTGYSSLSHPNRYAIDALRIDYEYHADRTCRTRTQVSVDSILSLGSALDVDIVAEGIETREELALLEKLDCPFGRGFSWRCR